MGRKFAMTSFLAFIYPEELEQIATGALITFVGLVVNLKYTPFITDGLNSLQNSHTHAPPLLALVAKCSVRGITLSTQNCAQAGNG